ncbi:uncharacterized protein EAF01_001694 [Botrytis porri]|uniref:uncharacterized protein n=1 Tax=Botrytis porri TaxID=87229 RepID=UPI0019004829|nr:uncharacterized protein EAF01_001694 [Botrytis porri]KAF7912673.1 hypothetical protein EAF01_001694 [Botrytis porri]
MSNNPQSFSTFLVLNSPRRTFVIHYVIPSFDTDISNKKRFLRADDFHHGLQELDKEMGHDEFLVGFAPIEIITAGGFLAVCYLKNRESTGDLDYIIDPEWATDADIQVPLEKAVLAVAEKCGFNNDWMNQEMGLFTTKATDKRLFEQAKKEDLVLFRGEHIIVYAAPIEWGLERKLRRIYVGGRERKTEFDMSDAVAMLKYLKDTKGPLDREYIRTLNMNGFDVVPDDNAMNQSFQPPYCTP